MARRPRRNRISRHPWTATATAALTVSLMVPMASLAGAWGAWETSYRNMYGALLLIALPPVILVLALYDPITSWLDRRLDR